MRIVLLASVFLLITALAFSQSASDSVRVPGKNAAIKASEKIDKVDSLNGRLQSKLNGLSSANPADSSSQKAMHKADSISSGFKSKADSIQLAYAKPINKLDLESRKLQHEIDSLTTLRLPTSKLTSKLDSLTKAKTSKITEMNQSVDNLKQKATKDLAEVTLPPQMQGPLDNMKQSIGRYKIPMANGKVPGIDASAKIPGLQLPSSKLNTPGLGAGSVSGVPGAGAIGADQLKGITNSTSQLSTASGQVKEYNSDIKKISTGELGDVKSVDKAAENQLMKTEGVGELKGKTGEIDKMKALNKRPDSVATTMVKQEVMKEATNHFKGQEVVLQQSMDKLTKLKSKYSEVKSVADLPKKLPNPLHDKPFIERFVPGITFQIINTGPFLSDVNVGALYRISPRFSAGAGWVQRVIFDRRQNREKVYGPRAAVQFNMGKGFSARVVPEVVNMYVPPQLAFGSTDNRGRRWEWSTLIGLKKEFKVYKNIRGNTEALYNLHSPQNTSPYHDQFVVRFGFEFPMKKNVKTTSATEVK